MALMDGLVSYWELDETSGDVIDSHGSNEGTNVNATRGVSGKINTAFEFNGTNAWVNIPDDPTLKNYDSFTVSAWIKRTTANNEMVVAKLDTADENNKNYEFRISSNKLVLLAGTGTGWVNTTGTTNLGTNWYYVRTLKERLTDTTTPWMINRKSISKCMYIEEYRHYEIYDGTDLYAEEKGFKFIYVKVKIIIKTDLEQSRLFL